MSNSFDERPSWDEVCMEIAIKLSKRATCKQPDRQVGCVIVTPDYSEILAWGYNGGPSNSDRECNPDSTISKGSRCQCVHAEMNALTKLNSRFNKDLKIYITLAPCVLCSTMVVNSKCISEVIYLAEYRDKTPIFILRDSGILVRKY